MKKYSIVIIILASTFFLLTACGANNSANKNKIVIAEQYGLAYAPVQLVKELKLLEKNSNNLELEWKQLSNTAAIRESMLAGEVDIAFMAIPPFLIAKDKGMEWKIFSGLSESPLALMTNREYINSLEDFRSEDRIALPQPGSIQHILLSMAAQREFSDAKKFDNQLLTMSHPDAMNALLSGKELSAHFASPPYLFLEDDEAGIKEILSGQEAFGGNFTFIIGVSTEKFYQKQPDKYKLFVNALNEALNFMQEEPNEAARILTDTYKISEVELNKYLSWPGMKFTSEIKGLEKFIEFMGSEGYISKTDYEEKDLIFVKEVDNNE